MRVFLFFTGISFLKFKAVREFGKQPSSHSTY